jgi:hypothetical protein
MDDYSWIDTWGMDPADAMFYGGDYSFDDPFASFDYTPWESDVEIFNFLYGPGGDSGWQVNSSDVNEDWNPFNNWTEGEDYDFSTYTHGSDWLDTGIFAPMYESGNVGPQNDVANQLSSMVLSQIDSTPTSGSSKNALSALNKILGTVGSAARSPLGQMAQALLGYAAKQKSISNQKKVRDTAAQIARAESQRGLAPNRTGLVNMDTAVKDPMSYVQPALPIQR